MTNEQIAALIRPTGSNVAQLVSATGLRKAQLSNRMDTLHTQGLAHKAKVGHRTVVWFTDADAAQRYEQRNKPVKTLVHTPNATYGTFGDGATIDASRAKVTICPPFIPAHERPQECRPTFSAHRVGVYPYPPATCAARAAA